MCVCVCVCVCVLCVCVCVCVVCMCEGVCVYVCVCVCVCVVCVCELCACVSVCVCACVRKKREQVHILSIKMDVQCKFVNHFFRDIYLFSKLYLKHYFFTICPDIDYSISVKMLVSVKTFHLHHFHLPPSKS